MGISRDFKIAIKMADQPAWKLASMASVNPNVLSKIITGAIKVKKGDSRVIRIAHLLGLPESQCFDDNLNKS